MYRRKIQVARRRLLGKAATPGSAQRGQAIRHIGQGSDGIRTAGDNRGGVADAPKGNPLLAREKGAVDQGRRGVGHKFATGEFTIRRRTARQGRL